MGRCRENAYAPDYVSPPGETLQEMITTLGMTQAELAQRTGRPKKTINEIIQGKAAITPETALQFERVLGTPASFWNQREQNYRAFLARQQETERLETQTAWLDRLPLRAMIKQGCVKEYQDNVEQLRAVLNFFGIASPRQWEAVTAVFRKSSGFTSNTDAVAVWLCQGEHIARQMACAPFDAAAFRDLLYQLRALTCETPDVFRVELPRRCAEVGVAVVIVPELPGTRVCGASRWLTPTKALIQLSLRYKRDDQFWFTFFHEAGHILLHGKRDAFVDEEDQRDDAKEAEANAFAAEMLIPAAQLEELLRRKGDRYVSAEDVKRFAAQVGIAPGIVVGRLQHEGGLPYTHLNGLKRRLNWNVFADAAA